MGVRFMEHILILTQDPAGTRDWWCQTLGLREGDHPDFGFPVHWLYIGDQDVIHTCQANYSDHQNRYLANARAAAPRPIPARSTTSASTAPASRSSSSASRPPASTSASTRRCPSCSSATRSTYQG
jgi:catechol 2,3-dioxygenase-like lactoylglutathione lyase family enzyme